MATPTDGVYYDDAGRIRMPDGRAVAWNNEDYDGFSLDDFA